MKYIIKEEENKKKTFEVSEKFRLLLPILLLVSLITGSLTAVIIHRFLKVKSITKG